LDRQAVISTLNRTLNLEGTINDAEAYVFRHYIYHEYLDEHYFDEYLTPAGIARLDDEPRIPMATGHTVYPGPLFINFGDSVFSIDIDRYRESTRAILREEGIDEIIDGATIAKVIRQHSLDDLSGGVSRIVAQVQTDGTLEEALLSTLVHVQPESVDMALRGELELDPEVDQGALRGETGALIAPLFCSAEHARCFGYQYRAQDGTGFSSTIELRGGAPLATWGSTESWYDFIILKEASTGR